MACACSQLTPSTCANTRTMSIASIEPLLSGSNERYVAAASADDRDQFTVPAGTVVVAVGRLPIRKAATVEIECA